MLATRSCSLSHLYLCSIGKWFVQDTSKWNPKLKCSCIQLFTVSGIISMLTHSRWFCLQKCEHSMHKCTYFIKLWSFIKHRYHSIKHSSHLMQSSFKYYKPDNQFPFIWPGDPCNLKKKLPSWLRYVDWSNPVSILVSKGVLMQITKFWF